MMKGANSTAALLIDDEPEYLQWVEEFLLRHKLTTDYARTLGDALERAGRREYRLAIVDMEIPAAGAASALATQRGPTAEKYPGLAAVVHLRTMGYEPYQVIAFTVHDDGALDQELRKYDCRYVLKGRPEDFKEAVEAALARMSAAGAARAAKRRRARAS
jgi:CheY-like chemotaxis protein